MCRDGYSFVTLCIFIPESEHGVSLPHLGCEHWALFLEEVCILASFFQLIQQQTNKLLLFIEVALIAYIKEHARYLFIGCGYLVHDIRSKSDTVKALSFTFSSPYDRSCSLYTNTSTVRLHLPFIRSLQVKTSSGFIGFMICLSAKSLDIKLNSILSK